MGVEVLIFQSCSCGQGHKAFKAISLTLMRGSGQGETSSDGKQ